MSHRTIWGRLATFAAAFVTAVVLWVHVTSGQSYEHVLQVPLRLQNLPAEVTYLDEPPPQVEVRVRGRGRFLNFQRQGIFVAIELDGVHPGLWTRPLVATDVVVPAGRELEVIEVVSPRFLSLEFDRIGHKELPVRVRTAGRVPEGYVMVAPPEPDPPRVMALGAVAHLEPLDSLSLEPLPLDGLTAPTGRVLDVVAPAGARLRLDPEQVTVRIDVQPVDERVFGTVPVHVVSGAEFVLAYAEPPNVRVAFRGAASRLEVVEPTSLYLTVDAGGLARGEYVCRIEGVEATGRMRLVPTSGSVLEDSSAAPAEAPVTAGSEITASVEVPAGLALTGVEPALIRLVLQ